MAHAQKPDFAFRAKRTSPFKSGVGGGQLTAGSRGVRISGGNAGYTMFRGSFPFTSPAVLHRVPSHFNWSLPFSRVQDDAIGWTLCRTEHFTLLTGNPIHMSRTQ